MISRPASMSKNQFTIVSNPRGRKSEFVAIQAQSARLGVHFGPGNIGGGVLGDGQDQRCHGPPPHSVATDRDYCSASRVHRRPCASGRTSTTISSVARTSKRWGVTCYDCSAIRARHFGHDAVSEADRTSCPVGRYVGGSASGQRGCDSVGVKSSTYRGL